uniref:Methyltransferase-like protein 9 (inferred by orthology to a human protein) n=1 Tax=Strongyloides venezuelensis TaxID=75913 RepID=A0A0K0F504_STRVS
MSRTLKLAQALTAKELSDEELRNANKDLWYTIDDRKINSNILNLYYPLSYDNETAAFLDNSLEISNSLFWQMFYSISMGFLSFFTTKTNINGILNRGHMHIFSTSQLRNFMDLPPDWNSLDKTILDLGAGDGVVTEKLSHFYKNVYTTELSPIMQLRLKQKGFNVIDAQTWPEHEIIKEKKVDVISVLNLLDRHYNPKLLLSQLRTTSLQTGAKILMAVVLPIKQYVEFHPTSQKYTADTNIVLKGQKFEEQVQSLITDIFIPNGFEVIKFSKVPYLCEGDHVKAYYRLTDALFLLKGLPKSEAIIENVKDNDSIEVKRQEL